MLIPLKQRFATRKLKACREQQYIESLKLKKGTISRKLRSGGKIKIQDDIFEKVKAILKDDNTQSAREIQQKLVEQGIRISNSSVTRALKNRK